MMKNSSLASKRNLRGSNRAVTIGELTLENDFLSGALGKAGLLGGKK
jgi:hypothetical protein